MSIVNNKGFVDVEGILTSIFVIGILSAIAVGIISISHSSRTVSPIATQEKNISTDGSIPGEATLDTYSSWKVFRGQIKKVEEEQESNGSKTEIVWCAAVVSDDGSMMNAETTQIMIEGVKACIALSPDRAKYLDQVIPCQ